MLLRRNYMALCQKVSDFIATFKGSSKLARCSVLFALINSFLEACVQIYFCFWHVFSFILMCRYAKNDRTREAKY